MDDIHIRLDTIDAKLNEACNGITSTNNTLTKFVERLDAHTRNKIIHQVPPCDASKEEFKRVRENLDKINTRMYKALMGVLAGVVAGSIGFIIWILKTKVL